MDHDVLWLRTTFLYPPRKPWPPPVVSIPSPPDPKPLQLLASPDKHSRFFDHPDNRNLSEVDDLLLLRTLVRA